MPTHTTPTLADSEGAESGIPEDPMEEDIPTIPCELQQTVQFGSRKFFFVDRDSLC